MSALIVILLVLGAGGLIQVILLLTAKQKAKARERQLRAMPVSALAAEARAAVRVAGWENIPEVAILQVREAWTEKELLDVLELLWTAVVEKDKELGQSGRDSNYFMFYDTGLAGISEALRERLGIPQPWERTPGR